MWRRNNQTTETNLQSFQPLQRRFVVWEAQPKQSRPPASLCRQQPNASEMER